MNIIKIIIEIIGCASGFIGIMCCFKQQTRRMGIIAIVIAAILVLLGNFFENDNIDDIDAQTSLAPTASSTETISPPIYGSSFTDAQEISIDDEFEARIDVANGKRSEHWYFFDTTEDINLSLSLSGESNMDLDIYLYNKNGEKQLVHMQGKDKIINLQYPIQSGRFYLKITSNISGWYSIKPSRNVSSYTNDESSSSDNNTYQKSFKITLGESQYGHLGYYNEYGEIDDTDYFKFTIESPVILNISLIADDPLDAKISLVAADGDETIAYDSGKNKKLDIVRALQAGTYYIRISRLNDYGGYVLSTQVTNPQYISDEEKNNSFQYAKSLSLGNKTYGQIGYIDGNNIHDREDWYSIQLNSNTVNISLAPIENKGSIHIALLDNTANDILASTYCSENISSCTKEKLEPGLYYVKVSVSGDDYGCYSLEIN